MTSLSPLTRILMDILSQLAVFAILLWVGFTLYYREIWMFCLILPFTFAASYFESSACYENRMKTIYLYEIKKAKDEIEKKWRIRPYEREIEEKNSNIKLE